MTAIPHDIDRVASDIVRADYSKQDAEPDWLIYLAIAKAIVAERHRCAVIARQWKETQHKSEQYAANTIADRIMAGDAA